MAGALGTQIAFSLTEDLYDELMLYARTEKRSRSEAIRYLVEIGLEAHKTRADKPAPLLLPPPAQPAPEVLTLTDLAALIRKAAEVNPFVRPLAEFLEGRV